LRGNDRTRGLDDKPERREIGNGVIRGLFVERLTPGMSAAVADDELIAIGWGFCHPQGAESTARAGRVFYNNLLTQFLAQALRNNTPGDIARATRGERDHQSEWASRETLRGGRLSGCQNRAAENGPAADERDDRAPFHSITSSARASSVGGTSRASALAVLRLMTSSYLVGACTGRSAGFSPRRMRSTYSAARRNKSLSSIPYERRPPCLA